MKKLITVLLTAMLLVAGSAHATVMDGNEFLQIYNRSDAISIHYLRGYIGGTLDQYEITQPELTKCLGTQVKMSQLVDAVALYLQANPQVRHYHPSTFIPLSIKKQFSCN